jgi:hypothetical protein
MPLKHVTVGAAAVLQGKINANSNGVDLVDGTNVGVGLYSFFSMANHSDQCALHLFVV